MSEQAHTPGPWVLTSDPYEDGTPYFKFSAGAGLFAEGGFNFSAIMSEADARLVVAAPALLAALKAVEPYIDAIVCYASTVAEHEPNGIAVNLRAALAKAEAQP